MPRAKNSRNQYSGNPRPLWLRAFNLLYANYARSAKKRNIIWALSRDQFLNLTKDDCHYCGIEPSQRQWVKKKERTYVYNGVDRLDNSIGYVIENCVTCCKYCNTAKNDMTQEEWSAWVTRVYENRMAWIKPSEGS